MSIKDVMPILTEAGDRTHIENHKTKHLMSAVISPQRLGWALHWVVGIKLSHNKGCGKLNNSIKVSWAALDHPP